MSNLFDDDLEIEEFQDSSDAEEEVEVSPTTKLERRRRIEELHEEKLLKAELADFEDL